MHEVAGSSGRVIHTESERNSPPVAPARSDRRKPSPHARVRQPYSELPERGGRRRGRALEPDRCGSCGSGQCRHRMQPARSCKAIEREGFPKWVIGTDHAGSRGEGLSLPPFRPHQAVTRGGRITIRTQLAIIQICSGGEISPHPIFPWLSEASCAAPC